MNLFSLLHITGTSKRFPNWIFPASLWSCHCNLKLWTTTCQEMHGWNPLSSQPESFFWNKPQSSPWNFEAYVEWMLINWSHLIYWALVMDTNKLILLASTVEILNLCPVKVLVTGARFRTWVKVSDFYWDKKKFGLELSFKVKLVLLFGISPL